MQMREEERCPRCRRRIARRDVEYAKFLLLELPCLLSLSRPSHHPVGKALCRPYTSPSRRPVSSNSSRCPSEPPSRLSRFHPFRAGAPRHAFGRLGSSFKLESAPTALSASRSITNVAKFLIGNGYSLAVHQGARAVARPLNLSGRNARLARPFFHPPVAFREHFSQRCPTLPQHFAQGHSHRGLCNCHRFIHARGFPPSPLPPPPPPPLPPPRCFVRAFLSLANRNRSRMLPRPGVIYGERGPMSGLSINYGQFSTLAFIYATPERTPL